MGKSVHEEVQPVYDSEDEVIDFGRSERIVKDYLKAMDRRMMG